MTIQAATARVALLCNGATTLFPVNIQAYNASDFLILATNTTGATLAGIGAGASIVLTLNSDYTMAASGTLAPPFWALTSTIVYPTGINLLAILNPTETHLTQYPQGQTFPSLAVQTDFDRLTQMVIRLSDQMGRTLRQPDGDVTSWNALVSAAARANTLQGYDASGNPTIAPSLATVLTQAAFNALLNASPPYVQTPAELAAGVTPVNYSYGQPFYDVRRFGWASDNNIATAAANVTNLNTGITVASQTIAGANGAQLILPTGIGYTNQTVILPNRVRIRGQNCSGSLIKAVPAFNTATPYMFYANNGTTAMFDSILEDIFIDCSSVAGLGGVQADAWQENSGLRSVAILNYATYGVHLQHGYGGASTCELQQIQLFCAAAGATAGIRVEQISSVGAFQLHVRDGVIAQSGAGHNARGIDMVNDSLLLENFHFEGATDCVYAAGVGNITLINCTGDAACTNLVHLAATFTGRLNIIGCQRNVSAQLVQNDVTGEVIISPDIDYSYPGQYSETTAKAWCVFNGTTVGTNAPTAGYNVTSVTRNSAGNYSVNLTRAMNNVNSMCPIASSNTMTSGTTVGTQLSSAGKFNVLINVAGVPTDSGEVKALCFGI